MSMSTSTDALSDLAKSGITSSTSDSPTAAAPHPKPSTSNPADHSIVTNGITDHTEQGADRKQDEGHKKENKSGQGHQSEGQHVLGHKKMPSIGAVPTSDPDHLPESPEENASMLTFQEVQYKDGGAHWYRASAVLLSYHK